MKLHSTVSGGCLKRLALPLSAGLIAALAGCGHGPYHPGPYSRPHVRYSSPYYYDYHFYPSTGVYFNVYSGRYYYRFGGRWVNARSLPSHIYIGPGDRIHTRIWSDRPYLHRDLHRKRFRPHPYYRRHWERNRFERRYNRNNHRRYVQRYRR